MSDWSDAQIGKMLGRIAALEKRVQELELKQQPVQVVGKLDPRGFYTREDFPVRGPRYDDLPTIHWSPR